MYIKIGQHELAITSPGRTESYKQQSRHSSLPPASHGAVCESSHCIFFPPLSGCWVCSEICWEKHGDLVLPLLLMLQGGRAMQIILEQEMWHGGRDHKQFCRNVTWKHFSNSFGFYCLSKNLKGTKLGHLAYRNEWLLQNTITSTWDISSHPFSMLVT